MPPTRQIVRPPMRAPAADIMGPMAGLTEPWTLGSLRVPNRVMLAPLAGIGNWFVRLQAKRFGAGMAVSEMISSHAVHHQGPPDLDLAGRLVDELPAPVILTGGLSGAEQVREAFARSGAAAVMLARGALGNPWLFAQLLRGRAQPPVRDEVLAELDWTMARAAEHL